MAHPVSALLSYLRPAEYLTGNVRRDHGASGYGAARNGATQMRCDWVQRRAFYFGVARRGAARFVSAWRCTARREWLGAAQYCTARGLLCLGALQCGEGRGRA